MREPIFAALFALGQAITWVDPITGEVTGWSQTARRVYTADQWGAAYQPALMQAEAHETYQPRPKFPTKLTLSANWVGLFQPCLAPDPTGPRLNTILDAIDAALQPDDPINNVLTLGGLVSHVWIEGDVFADTGDLDGQGMFIVPIKILVP